MDDYYFIGMGLVFVILLLWIFIMIRNRIKGRDELHGLFPMRAEKKKEQEEE